MRVAAYILILGLMFAAPVRKLDVAHLEPVEVVMLCVEKNMVCLRTDTKAVGYGQTAKEALKDMEKTTPGVIYLDTAEYLLAEEDALIFVDELRSELNDTVKLCAAENVDMEIADEYLETHGKLPKLKDWKKGDPLPLWNGKKFS